MKRTSAMRWVLVDPLPGGGALMAGDETYAAIAPKRVMNRPGVRVLLPAIEQAVQADADLVVASTLDDVPLTAHVRILRSPRSGALVGALAVIADPGEAPPEPPLVGTWEWEITPEDGSAGPTKKAYWSQTLSDLYGLSARIPGAEMSTAQWMSELVVPEDRHRLKSYIDQGIEHVSPALRILAYSIRTPRGRRHMRLIGRARQADAGVTQLLGMSHLSPGAVQEVRPDLLDPTHDDYVRTIVDLCGDSVIVLVELHYWQVHDRSGSAAWRASGLAPLDHDHPEKLVHPADLKAIANFFVEVANGEPKPPLRVQLSGADGRWHWYRLLGRRFSTPGSRLRQVICRVVREA